MSLIERIQDDITSALKSGDTASVEVLRLLTAAIQNKQIATGNKEEELSDEVVESLLLSEAKKRKEAIELFIKGDRSDLADKEKSELAIIANYLPEQMSEADIEVVVSKVVSAGTDFGSAMKAAMAELKGKADAKLVTEIVRKKIGG